MFLRDALESRVHFERLCDCHSAFGSKVTETASKEEGEGKDGEKKEAKVSVRIPKRGSSKVVRFRNARCCLFCGEGCSYLMLWRVVFTLSASAIAFPPSGPSLVSMRLQAKRKQRGEEVGKGRSKSQRAHSEERIKQGRPLQKCKGVVCLCRKKVLLTRCFGASCSL